MEFGATASTIRLQFSWQQQNRPMIRTWSAGYTCSKGIFSDLSRKLSPATLDAYTEVAALGGFTGDRYPVDWAG
jgi:hypothetical protein